MEWCVMERHIVEWHRRVWNSINRSDLVQKSRITNLTLFTSTETESWGFLSYFRLEKLNLWGLMESRTTYLVILWSCLVLSSCLVILSSFILSSCHLTWSFHLVMSEMIYIGNFSSPKNRKPISKLLSFLNSKRLKDVDCQSG